jgi:hypothetical protein
MREQRIVIAAGTINIITRSPASILASPLSHLTGCEKARDACTALPALCYLHICLSNEQAPSEFPYINSTVSLERIHRIHSRKRSRLDPTDAQKDELQSKSNLALHSRSYARRGSKVSRCPCL